MNSYLYYGVYPKISEVPETFVGVPLDSFSKPYSRKSTPKAVLGRRGKLTILNLFQDSKRWGVGGGIVARHCVVLTNHC